MCNAFKYHLKLTKEQRKELVAIVSNGKATAKVIKHAQILLHTDEGSPQGGYIDKQIAEIFMVSEKQIGRIRKRFIEEGLEAALQRKPHSRYRPRIVDGKVEAQIIALACSTPPKGHISWSIRLLKDKLVQLHIVEHIGYGTVQNTLKKMNLSLG